MRCCKENGLELKKSTMGLLREKRKWDRGDRTGGWALKTSVWLRREVDRVFLFATELNPYLNLRTTAEVDDADAGRDVMQ